MSDQDTTILETTYDWAPRHSPAAYRYLLGERPKCGPNDQTAARLYLSRIQQAIAQGGWTTSERNNLYALRKKWRARAEGRDMRFVLVGNAQGWQSTDTLLKTRILAGVTSVAAAQEIKAKRDREREQVNARQAVRKAGQHSYHDMSYNEIRRAQR